MDTLPDLISSTWVALSLPLVLMVLFAELGFRFGLRVPRGRAQHKDTLGGIQGAILGLLGLLLGFTFAMAAGRYDLRRELVLKEANAIGTTYLRASLLPAPHVQPVKDLLRRYVDLRLAYYPQIVDAAAFAEGMKQSAAIQAELWRHATEASREAPTAITATFVNALNDTIDVEAERIAAGRARIPSGVWFLLLIVAAFGCLTTSYVAGEEGGRSVFSSLVLPALVAIVLLLIYDIASPHKGFIGISQQPLVDLQQSIAPPPGR
jgi:hypothetical protein